MARTKSGTDKTKAKASGSTAPAAGKNELTDEQRQALFFGHKRKFEAALAKKKATDADFRNVCKLARAELGDDAVKDIKDAILLDSDEGEAKLRAEIERQMRVARWMNVPFGAQADLLDDVNDRRPATERARAEGKKAGMEGMAMKPPYANTLPQFNEWVDGWQEGQKAIFAIQRDKDADKFGDIDDERRRELAGQKPMFGDQPTTHQVKN